MTRSSLFLAIPGLLFILGANAQPFKYGCHYFRNQTAEKPQFTQELKDLIDETIARSDTFNILHYDIHLDVTDYDGGTIAASCGITFVPLMAGQTFIRFDLKNLIVDSVFGDTPMAFSQDGDFLRVEFAAPPPVGVNDEVIVYYHGDPYQDPSWGGVYFENDIIYNLGIGLTTVPPNFGKVLYPCFDSFVERAQYTWHVTSAEGRRLHGQGTMVGETVLGGDTVVRVFVMSDEIPTHVSAFAVGDYADSNWVHTGAYGPVPVRLTAKPANLPVMVSKFSNIGGAIDAMEHWYGPQPYGRVGYVHTTDGAMEHPTNIAYPSFMNGQSAMENQGLYSHELGHYWWGDQVTPRVHNHMWLKEGPAEYSSHLAEEWIHGRDAFVDMVKDNQLYVLKNAHVDDGGFQALSPMPDAQIYGTHTYYKGASVMHNLRGYLGDTLFRQAMSGVQTLLAGTDITPDEFRDALETASGADLHPFFNDQVFNPGFSVFVVQSMSATNSGGNWNVDLNIRQRLRACPDLYTQVPLDLTLIGANWQRQEYQIIGTDEFTPVSVDCDFEPVMAVLNGHAQLNQARMDHEFTIRPGESFSNVLPYVDFRLYDNVVPDSALFRVEHVWAGPDQDAIGWGIDEVSDTHYWIVDGLWPEGMRLEGRVNYDGQVSTDLDWELYGPTEGDALLVYRATPADAWEVYPYTTIVAGNLLDGAGYMKIDTLQRGQYAFANGNAIAALPPGSEEGWPLHVFPVPASDALTVQGDSGSDRMLLFDVLGVDGRLLQRTTASVAGAFSRTIDVQMLPAGAYLLRVCGLDGAVIGVRRFEVSR